MADKNRNAGLGRALSRRSLLRMGAGALALPILSRIPSFAVVGPLPPSRDLSFFNTHTGESLSVEYCLSGRPVPPSLERINHILRDHRTGEIRAIDLELLDLLNALSRRIGSGRAFHVISGYRSPRTNALLRARGSGVAAGSFHLTGKAIDIRVPGLRLRELYKTAVSLRGGGVGIYPTSNFVHIDVGNIRTW